jgi:serine/threonine protein kinase
MSVEQARGRDDIDLRADVWSAGAILYELSTGRLAFDAPNYNAVLDKIMHDEPLPLLSWGVNEPGLQAVVSRCLAKQRSHRYQSTKEVRAALEALLPSLPVGAGGLKLQASFGMAAAEPDAPDSKVPAPPDDDSPAIRAARNETLVAPPDSNPPTPTSVYRPAGRRPTARRAVEASHRDELVSVPEASEAPDFGAQRSRRIMALVGGIALAAGVAIAVSTSSGSGAAKTPVLASSSSLAPASIPSPAPDTHAPEHAPVDTPDPSPAAGEPLHPAASAAASAALPARKAATLHAAPAESAKAKPVTKVESAGF